uniref:Uncharacterized protein n=1 Tax=Chaetoceros debilis TaxID=122233 RepID=A0A7S3Q4G8_9STRA|mmetsp:Transcript_7288/g.10770  ORF Transcript_7288/g.10770 Transcript_7288/m.10770 type:complete len:110 (-) Transcript_7288:59-388(-)
MDRYLLDISHQLQHNIKASDAPAGAPTSALINTPADVLNYAPVLALSLFVTILAALSALADILVDVLILTIALVATVAVATVAAAKLLMYLSESSSMPPTHWLVSSYFP